MTMSINGGMEVKKVFIGAGCNRVVNNVSWGACDLVAFGAQNAVAIFSPKVPLSSSFHSINTHLLIYHQTDLFLSFVFWAVFQKFFFLQTAQILTTLPGHKASVNCTQWLPSNKFAFKGIFFNWFFY